VLPKNASECASKRQELLTDAVRKFKNIDIIEIILKLPETDVNV
jgi:hypothetical protein